MMVLAIGWAMCLSQANPGFVTLQSQSSRRVTAEASKHLVNQAHQLHSFPFDPCDWSQQAKRPCQESRKWRSRRHFLIRVATNAHYERHARQVGGIVAIFYNLHARHFATCFACIISFNSYNSPMRCVYYLTYLQMRKWKHRC